MSERRITLERGDYFELAALGERARRIEADAAIQVGSVRAKIDAVMRRLGEAHTFDPAGQFQLHDDGCVLIVTEKEPA